MKADRSSASFCSLILAAVIVSASPSLALADDAKPTAPCASAQPGQTLNAQLAAPATAWRAIEPAAVGPDAEEHIRLPISHDFLQTGTELCWAYAFLNALETNYMQAHPGSKLELSRRELQQLTMEDRFEALANGTQDHVTERGATLDAEYFIRKYGILQASDTPDVVRYAYYNEFEKIRGDVLAQPNAADKLSTAKDSLHQLFGDLPQTTNFEGQVLDRRDFAKKLLGDGKWVTYAPIRDNRAEGFYKDPDPDARRGEQNYFEPMDRVKTRIHQSLKAGKAVIFADDDHVTMIYGADYDADGNPIAFYFKDSRYHGTYRRDADWAFARLEQITVLEN